ncbi:MAG: acyl-CoA dehydrogenase [Legionella sp.]|nr:acyl-CoA dehydrogenase [Legionella sp.]
MSAYDDLLSLTNSFEIYLGDPATQETPVNIQDSLNHDEQDALPWAQVKFIQEWGFMEYLIPYRLEGKLKSLDELILVTRSISRRDLTTPIALGISFLAALPVWIAGSAKQQQYLAECLRRGETGAFGLTEEEHGSDAAANEFSATPCNEGWTLSGKKWCINFATFSQFTTLVCRTHSGGGPLGFSLFFLEKSQIKGLTPIPKLLTHGVRGLDISGFCLDNVFLPADALVGKEKRGLEIAYKTLQVTRALCAGFALGGADTALRLALSFSLQRHLYNKKAYDIPAVKQRLGEQFTYLLIADCITLTISRAASIMPEKLSFWSAIIKFLVPSISEHVVEQSGIILGARGYLRTTEWAMYQKMRRDVSVVSLFDGSSQVNLSVIASNLLPQAEMRGSFSLSNLSKIEQIFNISRDCPEFSEKGLRLFTHSEDDLIGGLAYLESEMLKPMIHEIQSEVERLDIDVISLKEQARLETRSLTVFRLAERYCWLFAASCCLQFWHYNQHQLPEALEGLDWITLAMDLILDKLRVSSNTKSDLQESLAERLCAYYSKHQMFSMVPTIISG